MDLLLLVKYKGDSDWQLEPNLNILGDITSPEWHRLWPLLNVPDLTSPPKGHQYPTKNIHSLSSDSETEDAETKRQKVKK